MVLAALVAAACGGSVVVDQPAGEGGGTSSAAQSSSTSSGGVLCVTPPPAGAVNECAPDDAPPCSSFACDASGNRWKAYCTSTSCICYYNDEQTCVCALNGPGDMCVSDPKCCPAPWIP